MAKQTWKPGNMIYPIPAVMVSVTDGKGQDDIITVAWTGTICTNPPMAYISVRPERYSYHMIKETGEFVINLTTEKLAKATDFCGVRSGRDVDKFKETGLTREKADIVSAPMIKESPVSIECKVKEIHEYGSHDMFIAEIVNVQAAEEWIDETGRIRLDKAGLICYNHGEYFGLRRQPLGRFGFSVMKPKTKKRLAAEQRRNTFRKKKQSRGRRL